MKPKYKVLIIYLITTFLLCMFLIMVPEMTMSKIEYQEINISEPRFVGTHRSGSVSFYKNEFYYSTTCRNLNNGNSVVFENKSFKNFCGMLYNYDGAKYKKILHIDAVVVKIPRKKVNSKKVLFFVKKIDYLDKNDNKQSFKIPDNLVDRNINRYLSSNRDDLWFIFILIYIFSPIYFYRKIILKPFKNFFNQTEGN